MKRGRNTGWRFHEVKRIHQELKRGNKKYQPDAILCTYKGCRNGTMINAITGKQEECPNCLGYGILRKD